MPPVHLFIKRMCWFYKNHMNEKQIFAVFDFDGTITSRDTFIDIIYTSFGLPRFLKACILFLPDLLRFVFKRRDDGKASEKVFCHFFRDMELTHYEFFCQKYASWRIDKFLILAAEERILWHKKQGHTLVIVSASMENWIAPWAQKKGFAKVIATKPEIKRGRLTGNFEGAYCCGEEKIRRFEKCYPLRKEYVIHSYGNSIEDVPFLKYSDYGHRV